MERKELDILEAPFLGEIPKLQPQWKIIHEFRPIGWFEMCTYVSLEVYSQKQQIFKIDFPAPNMRLVFPMASLQVDNDQGVFSCPAPLLGEWTRIEVTHEREPEVGRFTVALAVDGEEVGRVDVDQPVLRSLTDIKIFIGSAEDPSQCFRRIQYGDIREVVVLDKP